MSNYRLPLTRVEQIVNVRDLHRDFTALFETTKTHKKEKHFILAVFIDGDEQYKLKFTRTKCEWLGEDLIFSYILNGTHVLLCRSFGGRLSKMKIQLSDLIPA